MDFLLSVENDYKVQVASGRGRIHKRGTFFFYIPAINAWLKVKCVPLLSNQLTANGLKSLLLVFPTNDYSLFTND